MSGLQAGRAVPDFTLTTFEAEIGDFSLFLIIDEDILGREVYPIGLPFQLFVVIAGKFQLFARHLPPP